MKFKNWVSVMLLIITGGFVLLFFAEPFIYNYIGLIGSAINIYLLTKYSKICDYERRGK